MEEKKEKKTITISLGTGVALIVIILLSIIILAGVYFYEIQKIRKENIETNSNNIVSENVTVTENIVVNNTTSENNADTNTTKEENIGSSSEDRIKSIEGRYDTYVRNEMKEDRWDVDEDWFTLSFEKDGTFSAANAGEVKKGTYSIKGDDIECTITSSISEVAGETSPKPDNGNIKIKVINDVIIEVEKVDGWITVVEGMKFAKIKNENIKKGTYLIEGYSNQGIIKDQAIKIEEDNIFELQIGQGAAVRGVYTTSDKDGKIYCEILIWWAEAGGIAPQEAKGEIVLSKVNESTLRVESITKLISKKNEWTNEGIKKLDEDEEMDMEIKKGEIFILNK